MWVIRKDTDCRDINKEILFNRNEWRRIINVIDLKWFSFNLYSLSKILEIKGLDVVVVDGLDSCWINSLNGMYIIQSCLVVGFSRRWGSTERRGQPSWTKQKILSMVHRSSCRRVAASNLNWEWVIGVSSPSELRFTSYKKFTSLRIKGCPLWQIWIFLIPLG